MSTSLGKRPPKRRSGGGGALLLLLLLAPAGLMMMPTSVLVLAGLAPTFVAYLIDRDPEKSAAMTVGAMNLCGIAPFVVRLWQRGHEMAVTLRMLADPGTWLIMFGAAAIGWLMYFFIPQIVAAIMSLRSQAKIKELEERRSLLIADWGTEIMGKGDDKPEPAGLIDDPRD
ncbi:hypothetical protein [Niveispirillum cyanobacteriorum]|uniref:Uncharacterized protein n=1 Tax=Niveispirillum cyanobacteriorum TaxID=1612173 RepID=A0A2K9N7C8_9PROT|nr:hypothetical protein [Niveispirillum cyanobacteriorum]AUN28882.1 hypothetical protein C0V82_00385 [Niveispirillum cyanobacteriorum]GGE69552.1 hypothetical protein GCM10011317_28500 [Niveispirillum cyanobacteriorum]